MPRGRRLAQPAQEIRPGGPRRAAERRLPAHVPGGVAQPPRRGAPPASGQARQRPQRRQPHDGRPSSRAATMSDNPSALPSAPSSITPAPGRRRPATGPGRGRRQQAGVGHRQRHFERAEEAGAVRRGDKADEPDDCRVAEPHQRVLGGEAAAPVAVAQHLRAVARPRLGRGTAHSTAWARTLGFRSVSNPGQPAPGGRQARGAWRRRAGATRTSCGTAAPPWEQPGPQRQTSQRPPLDAQRCGASSASR